MNKLLLFCAFFAISLGGVLFFLFFPIAQFPKPSGSYGVGYKQYNWINTTRQELNARDSDHQHRQITAHCFYPTEKDVLVSPVAYDPDAAKSALEYFAKCSGLPAWLFSGIKSIKTHIQPNASIAQSVISFPIVIFSHGDGGPIAQSYTWMLEELASQGFVVVGINHSKDKAHDAQKKTQKLEMRTQDIGFAITKMEKLIAQKDPFWVNVDLEKIGMLGHSFGGRTTVRATQKDTRIKCGINLDGGIQDDDAVLPFTAPFMFMIAEKSFLWNKDHPKYRKAPDLAIISKLAATQNTNIQMVTIKNAGHAIFSDAPLQLNTTFFGRFVSRYALFGLEVPAGRAAEILVHEVTPHIINFFDKELKNNSVRESIFDRVVTIPKELILDIPKLPPLCDELPDLKKGFVKIKDGELYYEPALSTFQIGNK